MKKFLGKMLKRKFFIFYRVLWDFFYKRPCDFLLRKREFRCKRCGACCGEVIVPLEQDDIQRMQEDGLVDFVDYIDGVAFVKKKNGACMFLLREDGLIRCAIYDKARPAACVSFPRVKSYFGVDAYDSRCKAFKFTRKSNRQWMADFFSIDK